MKRFLTALMLATPALAAQAEALPEGAIQARAEQMQWQKGPPSLPPGTQMMVLDGDPKKEGLFTMRLKVPAGTKLPPHWHPRHERVTVLEGAVAVGFGDRFDDTRMTVLRAGSYYVNPPMAHHYVGFPEEAVVQITTAGPWEVHYVE